MDSENTVIGGSSSSFGRFFAPSWNVDPPVSVGGVGGHPEASRPCLSNPSRDLLGKIFAVEFVHALAEDMNYCYRPIQPRQARIGANVMASKASKKLTRVTKKADAEPVLLSGGNPQIPKGDGIRNHPDSDWVCFRVPGGLARQLPVGRDGCSTARRPSGRRLDRSAYLG